MLREKILQRQKKKLGQKTRGGKGNLLIDSVLGTEIANGDVGFSNKAFSG